MRAPFLLNMFMSSVIIFSAGRDGVYFWQLYATTSDTFDITSSLFVYANFVYLPYNLELLQA